MCDLQARSILQGVLSILIGLIKFRGNIFEYNSHRSLDVVKVNELSSRKHQTLKNPSALGNFANSISLECLI